MSVEQTYNMTDISNPSHVQIVIRSDSKTIWINVDGICRLRVCGIPHLDVADERKELRYTERETE